MRKRTQEERILDMIKRPVPRKRVGIVHLEMVRESRTLYGMKRFQNPREAAEMVRPLCEKADREMVLVLLKRKAGTTGRGDRSGRRDQFLQRGYPEPV